MDDVKILIVEDELITAKDLEMYTHELHYKPKFARKDIEVFEILKTFIPDIILMDISLKDSNLDGIELASEIIKTMDIPIIFTTAYSDSDIIERAGLTSPYGYLLKPVELKDFEIAIKIALHKHKTDKIIKEKENWFSKSLRSINEGFIAVDINDNIKFMNYSAEVLTGYKENEAVGKNINSILSLTNDFKSIELILSDSEIKKSIVNIFNKIKNIWILVSKNNKKYIVNVLKSEITDNNIKYGYIYVINDMTKTVNMNIELSKKNLELDELNKSIEIKVQNKMKHIIEERKKLKERNEFIENDLILARNIQIDLLPSTSPFPEIKFIYKPVEKVGGDFFDFVKFREPELIGIFLCDVSGHGVSASFVTMEIKNIILESGKNKLDPKALLLHLNEKMLDKTGNHFITAFYGIYNNLTKKFVYSNAGQNIPFYIENDNVKKLPMDNFNLPLSVFDNEEHKKKGIEYKNYEITLNKNSKLFIFTDGLMDIKSKKNCKITSDENIISEILKNHSSQNDSEIFINLILDDLIEFKGDDNFEDDITIVCIGN